MVARIQSVGEKSAERRMREDLAAAHRLVERFGWTELIYNHATARVPGRPDHMLVKPDRLLYQQVNASNLVECDLDGNLPPGAPVINRTVPVIHGAIYKARPDVHAILHTHTPAGMAVSAMECGLLPLNQTAMQFHNRIGYHEFMGVAENFAECEHIVRALGPHGALILRNHGLLTVGSSVSQAFVRLFYLERCCQAQVMLMTAVASNNTAIHMPDPAVIEQTARCWDGDTMQREWPAYIALLDREEPDYRD
jgi:ribulose-5-phosphate 4-epimerase/fuculose-1-phosphate aldolase